MKFPIVNLENNRKYYITVMSLACSTLVIMFGKISGEIYLGLILGTVGAFITGNVMEWKARNAKTES